MIAALRLGERAERLGRVAEQRDAQHSLGVAVCAVETRPTTIPALFTPGGRPRGRAALVVEIVLLEDARQQVDDVGRVHRPAPAGLDDPARALVERLQRPPRRVVDLRHHAAPGGREEAQTRSRSSPPGSASGRPPAPSRCRGRPSSGRAGRSRRGARRADVDRRPDVEHHAVPQQPLARAAVGLERADPLERRAEHALELWERDDVSVIVADGREVAHLGDGE